MSNVKGFFICLVIAILLSKCMELTHEWAKDVVSKETIDKIVSGKPLSEKDQEQFSNPGEAVKKLCNMSHKIQ